MTPVAIPRPAPDEHAPYMGAYVERAQQLLDAAGWTDLRTALVRQPAEVARLLAPVTDGQAQLGYAPGKWSLSGAWLHVIDSERVFAYRALRASRGDSTPLPGFEHDEWVPNSGAAHRTLASLVGEFGTVRAATVALFDGLDADMLARRGHASGVEITARAMAWVIVGHAAHHVDLTQDRYLPALR